MWKYFSEYQRKVVFSARMLSNEAGRDTPQLLEIQV